MRPASPGSRRLARKRKACYNFCMTKPLKLIKIGNSTGIVLPKELLARLRVELGDELFVSEVPEGFTISKRDPDFEAQMEVAREVMARRRAALRELAK